MADINARCAWRDQARDAFIRAAAAMVEWPTERDALALALLEGARGLLFVTKIDEDGNREALETVTRLLNEARARASDRKVST